MKRRLSWFSILVLISAAIQSTAAYAADAKTPAVKAEAPAAAAAEKKDAAPVLAGFGMIAPKHSCTEGYGECMDSCGKTGGASCELECVSDCNVCSLDFGEEALDVCRQ
jgi:hypothetical protein